MLNVNGNVEGVTKLIVHASSDADIRGKGEILFAESENDTTGNEGSFVVSRVYKSPYLFDVNYTQRAENSNQWGLTMNEQSNGQSMLNRKNRMSLTFRRRRPRTAGYSGQTDAFGRLP